MLLGRVLREPLVQFLAAGAALFALEAAVRPEADPRHRIEIGAGEIDRLREAFARQWMRPPSESELAALIDGAVREEIHAREAIALGLDRDDVVVRRRLAQKYEFVGRELLAPATPTEAELAAYLAENSGRYARPERVTFEQLFFGAERRADPEADARAALAALARGERTASDPILVPRRFADSSPEEVGHQLGGEFARELAGAPAGEWSGPVRSSYGWHLIRVEVRLAGAPATLAEVRSELERDWKDAEFRRREAEVDARLRARYEVVVAPSGTAAPELAEARGEEPRPET